ncbi:hypothetical protein [Ferrovibrio sp.]|uniref:hypothetical protein n=1 Tax=Ferrovibrio sp. TaxID=1917215 RepID=UPI0035B49241
MCTIALAGLALTAVSTAASISGQQQQAKSQKAAYTHAAKVAETEAALRRQDRMREAERTLNKQMAAYGASGVTLDGTPMDVFSNTQAEYARAQYMDDFNTSNRVGSLEASSANTRANPGPALAQLGGTALDYAARNANRG